MRTIISGQVTQDHLDDADLLAGISPTSYVTNGLSTPPASQLRTDAMPICMMQPEYSRVQARNYTLVENADALICVGENPHLVELARNYGLDVYEVAE
jgi:hypothetical protein